MNETINDVLETAGAETSGTTMYETDNYTDIVTDAAQTKSGKGTVVKVAIGVFVGSIIGWIGSKVHTAYCTVKKAEKIVQEEEAKRLQEEQNQEEVSDSEE